MPVSVSHVAGRLRPRSTDDADRSNHTHYTHYTDNPHSPDNTDNPNRTDSTNHADDIRRTPVRRDVYHVEDRTESL